MEPVMNAEELTGFLAEVFPQVAFGTRDPTFRIAAVAPGAATVILRAGERELRPGGTVSGPALFTLADVAAYTVILAHVGREALAVTTNLNINFTRKAPPGEVVGQARLLKLGRKLAVFDVAMEAAGELVAHATGTYALPSRSAVGGD